MVRRCCEDVGRDPATLETSVLITAIVDENAKTDQFPPDLAQRMVAGGAASIADQIKAKVIDAGVDSVILNLAFYRPGLIAEVGEALRPVVGL